MFNSNTSYFVTGAAINFCLSGAPDAVARDVNLLFNYGVISKVPVSFKEGESSNVVVQSDKGRTERGLRALAQNKFRGSLRAMRARSYSKGHFLLMVEAEALATFAEMPRQRIKAEKLQKHVPHIAACELELDEDDELTPEAKARSLAYIKKMGREILSQWFGAKGRDSVSGRNPGFED